MQRAGVLVTGGAGHIGAHVVLWPIETGHVSDRPDLHVRAIDYLPDGRQSVALNWESRQQAPPPAGGE